MFRSKGQSLQELILVGAVIAWGQKLLGWVGFILEEIEQDCGNSFPFFPRCKEHDLTHTHTKETV